MKPEEAAYRAETSLNERWQVGSDGLGGVLKEAWRGAQEHDLPGLAADISYHATLAVLPFLLLIVALPTVVSTVFAIPNLNELVVQKTDKLFSEDVSTSVNAVLSEVSRANGWTAVALALSGVIWAGSSTTSTIRKALNRVYGYEETMSFWRRKLYAVGLTIAAGTFAILALVLVLLGPGLVGDASSPLLEAAFLVLGLASILLTVAVLYWLAPSVDNTFRWVTPGAALFALVWLTFSFAFSAYLGAFSSLNSVYGTLGAMLIVVIWLYWSSMALLAGAEINAVVGRRLDPKVSRDSGTARAGEPVQR